MGEGALPPRLSELLDPAARRAGIQGGIKVGVVWSKWESIVGREVAAHAEPSSLRAGVLRVRADSPAWASELTYFGLEIRRRANEVAGASLVTEVRVWTGPGAPRRDRGRPAAPAAGSSGTKEVIPPADRDRDGDPRAILERAYRAWQSSRRDAARRPEITPPGYGG